jgi:hypothetical protein
MDEENISLLRDVSLDIICFFDASAGVNCNCIKIGIPDDSTSTSPTSNFFFFAAT